MVGKKSFSKLQVEILSNIMEELYKISSITYYTNCIFGELLSFCKDFCIIKIKLAFSRLYIVN